MRCIVLHSISLALAIRVDELDDDQRIVRDTVRHCNRERVALHCLDWTPNVDDLHTRLQKLVGFIRQVEGYAGQCSIIRLVNVDALDRSTELVGRSGIVGWLATDRVVEDVDACGASTVRLDVTSERSNKVSVDLRILQ